MDDADEALDDWYGSLRYLGRAADSASRKAIRSIEDTVYMRVMTKISPFYFDNDLVSANIQRKSIQDNDSGYVFEVNINDDLKVTVSEYLGAHEEVDRWHIKTEPVTNHVEAAEGVDAPNNAGASLGYAADNLTGIRVWSRATQLAARRLQLRSLYRGEARETVLLEETIPLPWLT